MKATVPETWRDMGATDYGRGWGGKGGLRRQELLPLPGALRTKPQPCHLNSSCRKRSRSEVTAIFATSLMSEDIMLPGFATADNLLGAHCPEVAGEGPGR